MKAKILETKQLTPTVWHITLDVSLDFIPGQFISILGEKDGEEVRKPYSIVSQPGKKIELCMKKLECGVVSTKLCKDCKGNEIEFLGPMGRYNLKDDKKECIFIATGAGIAPFRSMIPHVKGKVTLLAGYRFEDEVLYDDEFKAMDIKYRVITSREGEKGHVQDLVKEHIPDVFEGDIYVCGNFDMIKEVTNLLVEKGIDKKQIIFERYN
jgi:NAD(P)H-flavin reductase